MHRSRVAAQHDGMHTTVHEIAEDVYRMSTYVDDGVPGGFTFNQFLVAADEPLLFHTGPRAMFPLISAAVAKVIPLDRLRWISFGHVESDECGSMNQWLAAAPNAEVVFNGLGCDVSLNDLADRPPRPMDDDAVLDLGGHTIRLSTTPHVPHGWEAQVMFDETTRTLFCGDLGTQIGSGPAIVHDTDVVTAALAADEMFGATGLTPDTAPTIRRLAALAPRTLALMHGPAFAGDGAAVLDGLADGYAARLAQATDQQVARS
jgi:flavorubredoxin